jgi:hypothetical protein
VFVREEDEDVVVVFDDDDVIDDGFATLGCTVELGGFSRTFLFHNGSLTPGVPGCHVGHCGIGPPMA